MSGEREEKPAADCYTCSLLGFEDGEHEHEHTFDDLVRAEFAERSARPRRSRALFQLVDRAKAVTKAANSARQTAELTIEIFPGIIARLAAPITEWVPRG